MEEVSVSGSVYWIIAIYVARTYMPTDGRL